MDTPTADSASQSDHSLSNGNEAPAEPIVITVTNQKGGVGKTTTALNLAACLAANDRRVLLIDVDPQGNAGSGLGISKYELDRSIYDVLVEQTPLSDVLHSTSIDSLSIAPANQDLIGAEVHLTRDPNGPFRLRQALQRYVRKSPGVDYVLIDCPPSLGLLTVNALIAAHSVLIPIQAEYYALEGMADLVRSISIIRQQHNPALGLEGFLLTMADTRLTLCRQVESELRDAYDGFVFKSVIHRSVRLSEAPSHGMPITQYDPKSKGALSYETLAQEMIRNEAQSPRPWPFGHSL